MTMAPSLPSLVVRDWQPAWGVDVAAVLVGLAYVSAAARAPRWPWWRTTSFLGGLALVVVALQSGIGAFDDRLLSDHMVQHLLLLSVAPPLLLAGRPLMLVVRGGPRPARAPAARGLRRLSSLTHPFVCLGVFYAVVLGTHVPGVYDAAVSHPTLHECEHGVYLVAGTAVWWPMVDGDPAAARRLSGLGRLAYVTAAMLPMTAVGVYLYRAPSLFYPAYAGPARGLGVSALADQALAGSIMWVAGGFVMGMAGLWQVMAALVDEERRMQARERAVVVSPEQGRGR